MLTVGALDPNGSIIMSSSKNQQRTMESYVPIRIVGKCLTWALGIECFVLIGPSQKRPAPIAVDVEVRRNDRGGQNVEDLASGETAREFVPEARSDGARRSIGTASQDSQDVVTACGKVEKRPELTSLAESRPGCTSWKFVASPGDRV
jgi:hypothetical protein